MNMIVVLLMVRVGIYNNNNLDLKKNKHVSLNKQINMYHNYIVTNNTITA